MNGLMATFPHPDDSFARLHAAGWSIGDVGTVANWLVTGTNGENVIRAEGQTQAEAWHRACQQAEAVGMLG
jgi:hypothetical protein